MVNWNEQTPSTYRLSMYAVSVWEAVIVVLSLAPPASQVHRVPCTAPGERPEAEEEKFRG